jgi:plasmid stabilization system protein ParE
MHYKILVTKSFESDLDSVLSYISVNLKNRSAAVSLLKKVKDNIAILDTAPLAFPVYYHINKNEYHFISVGNYLIFYHVDETEAVIYVDRFLYSARNIETVL